MDKFKEGDRARVSIDFYNYIQLTCSYVSYPWVFFVSDGNKSVYKLNTKTNKAYFYNSKFSTWDTLQEEIKLVTIDDVWNSRIEMNKYLGD